MKIVENAWNDAFLEEGSTIREGITRVGAELTKWDKEVLGELKGRIRNVKKQLEACRRSPLSQQQVNRE